MRTILSVFCTAVAPAAFAAERKPNVVLIISDDHGFGDYGFMGSKVARTPHLDRIASQSRLYTRGYATPLCSPSLACLLTGKLPSQHGVTGNDLGTPGPAAAPGKGDRSPLAGRLLGNSLILPRALTDAGYLTFQSGKLWNTTYQEVGFTHGMTTAGSRHGDAGLDIGRKGLKPLFEFIENARRQEKPFFVWYAPMMPHSPHNPPAALLEKYQGRGPTPAAEAYFAMVEWFDQTCGELDRYLADNGLAEDTVLVYLADNGWDAAAGLRSRRAKLSPYELGIRTPMFVRRPGKVTPRRDDKTLASIVDVVPTILKAAGLPVPADLPGLDLTDAAAAAARRSVFVEAYTHDIADLSAPAKSVIARVVIDGWSKLIVPGPARPDKPHASAPTAVELFDLKADPLETTDLASRRPDEVKRLRAIQDAAWKIP